MDVISLFHDFLYLAFLCDCNKFCWNQLKKLAVFEAYATVDKNIFVSSKICFEWNLFFIVTIPLKLTGSSKKKTETVST